MGNFVGKTISTENNVWLYQNSLTVRMEPGVGDSIKNYSNKKFIVLGKYTRLSKNFSFTAQSVTVPGF